jgi:hypothetical protein
MNLDGRYLSWKCLLSTLVNDAVNNVLNERRLNANVLSKVHLRSA